MIKVKSLPYQIIQNTSWLNFLDSLKGGCYAKLRNLMVSTNLKIDNYNKD